MKVKAIQTGFFGGSRRRAGKVFNVPDSAKGSWFVPVTADAPQDEPAAEVPAPVRRGRPRGSRDEAPAETRAAIDPVEEP